MTLIRPLPGPAAADDSIARDERAESWAIIREVHAYCATRCPHRERCPGMACKQYQREMAAKDVIARLDGEVEQPAVGPGGIILEPTVR